MSVLAALSDERCLWTDREGRVWAVDEMDASHVANLRRWLARRAESLKVAEELGFLSFPAPTADAASDAYEDAFDWLLRTPARRWLRESPLYRALLVREWRDRRA